MMQLQRASETLHLPQLHMYRSASEWFMNAMGVISYVICAAAVFLTCSQQHDVNLLALQQQLSRSIPDQRPNTLTLSCTIYITMPVPLRVVVKELGLVCLGARQSRIWAHLDKNRSLFQHWDSDFLIQFGTFSNCNEQLWIYLEWSRCDCFAVGSHPSECLRARSHWRPGWVSEAAPLGAQPQLHPRHRTASAR